MKWKKKLSQTPLLFRLTMMNHKVTMHNQWICFISGASVWRWRYKNVSFSQMKHIEIIKNKKHKWLLMTKYWIALYVVIVVLLYFTIKLSISLCAMWSTYLILMQMAKVAILTWISSLWNVHSIEGGERKREKKRNETKANKTKHNKKLNQNININNRPFKFEYFVLCFCLGLFFFRPFEISTFNALYNESVNEKIIFSVCDYDYWDGSLIQFFFFILKICVFCFVNWVLQCCVQIISLVAFLNNKKKTIAFLIWLRSHFVLPFNFVFFSFKISNELWMWMSKSDRTE